MTATKTMRRGRGAWTAALALLLGGAACKGEHPPDDRPPVVLITLDTARVDHLSVYGYGKPTTPRLEELAADSVVFSDCVGVSSWTLPAHASLFTGLFPSTHGAHYDPKGDVALSNALGEQQIFPHFKANGLPRQAVTLAEVLRDDGYTTFGVGAGPWLKPVFGLSQGFEEYDCESTSSAGRTAQQVNDLALPFLRREHRRPFLLFLNYFDAHDPYNPPPALAARFLDDPRTTDARARTLANYDAELAIADAGIGQVLDELRAQGLYDKSWIVVVSDHGEHFGEHGLEMHGFSLFEDVVRCALLVKAPAGHAVTLDPAARVQHVDVMPYLLRELGVRDVPAMEGAPLDAAHHPVVAELFENRGNVLWKGERFQRTLWAIYSDRHKLILSSRPDDPDAGLFDLASDPDELRNLTPVLPDRTKELGSQWSDWCDSLLPPLARAPLEGLDAKTLKQLEDMGYAGKR